MRATVQGSGRKPFGQLRSEHSGRGPPCGFVMIITWLFIAAWCIFFLAAIRTGDIFNQSNPTVVYVENALGSAEKTIEKSLRGIAVPVEQLPDGPPLHAAFASARHTEQGDMHVIFSTDCTPYQDWQTIVVFHSATVVGQVGPITRIASGCDEAKKVELTQLYAQLYPQYHVHFTPDFKKDTKTQKSYDFYNKPWGLKHWLEHAQPPVPADVIVALIDPDMVFMRPLTTAIRGVANNIFDKSLPPSEIIDHVTKGRPVAQLYGLGAPWTNDHHLKFNRTRICGAGSRCLVPDMPFGDKHYSVGPPYVVHRHDLQRIANTWTTFVPRVYEGYPYLLAEMYAYSMAAAHEDLPHLQVEHYMVSNTEVAPGEGWPWVDSLQDVCQGPNDKGIYFPGQPLPTFMHYCQFFRVGELGFQKRRIPKKVFSCESPMMVEPPNDLGSLDYRIKDGKVRLRACVDLNLPPPPPRV